MNNSRIDINRINELIADTRRNIQIMERFVKDYPHINKSRATLFTLRSKMRELVAIKLEHIVREAQ